MRIPDVAHTSKTASAKELRSCPASTRRFCKHKHYWKTLAMCMSVTVCMCACLRGTVRLHTRDDDAARHCRQPTSQPLESVRACAGKYNIIYCFRQYFLTLFGWKILARARHVTAPVSWQSVCVCVCCFGVYVYVLHLYRHIKCYVDRLSIGNFTTINTRISCIRMSLHRFDGNIFDWCGYG